MTAFLLIWSPRKWPWPELPDVCAEVARRQALSLPTPVADMWGCGFSRSLVPGDRVFIHRVAQEPKGLFASGWVSRAPYEVPDPQRKRGYRLVIDFTYDWLVDAHHEVVIKREELRSHPFSVQTWDAQSSGNVIKPMVEGPLEKLWAQRTGARRGPPALTPTKPTGEG